MGCPLHQALVAATLLEGHIKRLSCSITNGWSGSHGQLGSHQHSHSRIHMRSCRRCPSVSQQEQIPSAVGHTRDSAKRWAPFLSPVGSRRWVTFEQHRTEETSDESEPVEEDLGPPPSLDLDLEHFLGGCPLQQGAEGRRDPQ